MNRNLLLAFLLLISPFFLKAQIDESKPFKVTKAYAYVKTAPLSELAARISPDKEDAIPVYKEIKNRFDIDKWANTDKNARPGLVQTEMGTRISRGPGVGFNGQGPTGSYPPDTDGDVSDEHFIQMVNAKYNVYEKDGTKILGPLDLSTLWNELPPGNWGNDGDPIILWDEEAERWVLTQFRVNSAIKYELFAISETSDPLGAYHLYAFSFGTTMNDYPKIGVWIDGYYATYNMFQSGSFTGSRITAVNRDKMLIGDPDAEMIEFHKNAYYATMPPDIDGENLPEDGAPCPILYINNNHQVEVWNFTADWENTSNSSLVKQNPNIIVSSFSETPNTNNNGSGGFIKQPGTSQRLDGLGAMIMNRLAYRKFDTHESMVTNHSILVQPGGGGSYDRSGVRWYEFRKTSDVWELHQEGTFAPDDGVNRWMGSAAMNANGDIALGYSVSDDESVYPSIRYTGRHADDPLGVMTIEEVELKTGTSSQNHWRWGDYSCLNVDPADDTTFWFTTEYNGWRTWIASFDLGQIGGATADAGEDAYICVNDQYTTSGSGTGVLEIEWTTDGDGFFSPDDQFNSTYIRGSQDVANGGCTLTMTVTGYDGGTTSDDMYLNIVPWVNAGEDVVILDTDAFQLEAEGTETGTIEWTTSGDGVFSDVNIMTPIYTPGDMDISDGQVTLSVEVVITDPCEDDDSDQMTLFISGVGLDEIENASILTLYPNPTNDIFTLNIDNLKAGEDFTYFVYTSYGKEVFRQVVQAKSQSYQKILDMSDFVSGIYFVVVKTEKGTTTQKLVKN